MCNVFCKVFSGWCRSFTRTEVLLVIIEALILIVFVLSTVFLILHLLACGNIKKDHRDTSNYSHKPEAASTKFAHSPYNDTVYTTQSVTSSTSILPDNETDNTHETFDVTSWTSTLSDNAIDNIDGTSDVTSRTPTLSDKVTDDIDDTSHLTSRSPTLSDSVSDDIDDTSHLTSRSPTLSDSVSDDIDDTSHLTSRSPTLSDSVSDDIDDTSHLTSRSPTFSENNTEDIDIRSDVTSRPSTLSDNVTDDIDDTSDVTPRTPTFSDRMTDDNDDRFDLTYWTPIHPDTITVNTNGVFDLTSRTSILSDSITDDTGGIFDITSRTTISGIVTDIKKTNECTWGEPTKALTHYYYTPTDLDEKQSHGVEQLILAEMSDGMKETDYKRSILALAKVNPYVFGCTLSVISEYWTVTAADCVQSIQEQDNLESYLMLENTENGSRRNHTVGSVKRHPFYKKGRSDYDIVALKSVDGLLGGKIKPLGLPLLIDYLMITFGETLTILGFGAFRKSSSNSNDAVLRRALVHKLAPRSCQRVLEPARIPRRARHLVPLKAAPPPPHPPPLCAGVVATATAPCAYCAGSPLVADGYLVGVMAARSDCSLSCRPALYVNVAAVKQWLHFIIVTE